MVEIQLLFSTADVGDANSAHRHATQFIARVNHLVFIVVVEQLHLLPRTIGTKTFELEERSSARLAKVEVHTAECNRTISGEREVRTHRPGDDFVRRSHFHLAAIDADGLAFKLRHVGVDGEGVILRHHFVVSTRSSR